MKRMKKMKKMNKKGFSIVEVIIAMTVIAIVSASALTIVLKSFDNTRAAMYKADAQYLVYDALECFKVSNSPDEFAAAFTFRFGGNVAVLNGDPSLPQPAAEGEANDENNKVLWFMILDSQYIVEVDLAYNKIYGDPPTSQRNIFSIRVRKPGADGELVASIIDYHHKINVVGG